MDAYRQDSLKNVVWAVYVLMAMTYFVPLTGLIGVIIAYIKRPDAEETLYHYHFTWLINTFWIALSVYIVGFLTLVFVIGWAILFGGFVWILYRLVKGGLRLNEERSPYDF